MKKLRHLRAFVAVLVCFATIDLFAQEFPNDLEVIYQSDDVRVTCVYCIDEIAFLAFAATDSGSRALMKITYEGEILDSISLPNNRLELWRHANFMNGKLRYVSFRLDDNDTLPLLCVVDVNPGSLSLTYTGYNWEGLDFNHPSVTQFYTKMIYPVFSKDGSLALSYPVDSLWMINQKETMHLVKFDNEGNMVKERVFRDYKGTLTNFFFSTPDSLGYRLVLMNPDRYDFDCHTLDSDLNTVSIIDSVGRVPYANQWMSGWLYGISDGVCSMRFNPYNGRAYSVGSESAWVHEDDNTNVIMTAYDEGFEFVNWSFGIINPDHTDEGYGKKTTDAYQRFNLGALRFYTRKETGRSTVDPPYRHIYNKYYGKACWGNPIDDMIMQAIIVNDTTPFSQLPYGIDSLVIIYWAGTKAVEYIITIPNMLKMSLKDGFSDARQSIDSPCLTRSMVSYLRSFYIDETIPIIVSKRKREFVVSADYSCLSIKAYKKGNCIMSKDTQLGEERNDVTYHPDFIVFWNLLNELVDEFDGRKP